MSELVRRGYYESAAVSRQARKELARIEERARVQQAAMEARGREELAQIAMQERNAQYQAQQRIRGGYDLAEHTVSRAALLNQRVSQVSRDNPGLELVLRDVEHKAALGAGLIVYEYMNRR